MASHFERGVRLFDRRWLAAALWEWQQHLPEARRNPAELARTFNAMSTALMEQGEYHQAFVKAELARDTVSQLANDHPQAFYAHLNGALAALNSGDLEVARGLAEGAMVRSRSCEVPAERRVQVMVIFAHIAIECEQYDVTASWLAKAGEMDLPQSDGRSRIFSNLALDTAVCRGSLMDRAAGEAAFAEALDMVEPAARANLHVERGWMRLRDGDVPGALVDAQEVVDSLLGLPAYLTLPDAADGLMLLSALARAHGDTALSSRLYMQGFAWLATAGWRAHLRRTTRAAAHSSSLVQGQLDLPKWGDLVRVTEALSAGEHRGPGRPQRLGRAVHGVARQFAPRSGPDVLGTAAVFLRLRTNERRAAALPARTLVQRIERGRHTYDSAILGLLDSYDQAIVEEGLAYPAVLERMTREAGTSWDPRAVHRILLAHAS